MEIRYIEYFLLKNNVENYVINIEDGYVDINGDVDLSERKLGIIPIKFRKVSGYFNVSDNNLTTLKNSPEYVGGRFNCRYNKLKSMEHCPKTINGILNCKDNELMSMDYIPMDIDPYDLWYDDNNIPQMDIDKYWSKRLKIDPKIFVKIYDKVSSKIYKKYSYLLASEEHDLY